MSQLENIEAIEKKTLERGGYAPGKPGMKKLRLLVVCRRGGILVKSKTLGKLLPVKPLQKKTIETIMVMFLL